jgi:restriction system protein
MRPLLAYYEDGQEHSIAGVRERLAQEFALAPAELEERIPSGRAKTFANRVGWATTYLYRTGLLDRPRRSVYRITERGRQVLRENPARVDLGVLKQLPGYEEFRTPDRPTPRQPLPPPPVEDSTPEETIDAAYTQHREALAQELLDRIRQNSPSSSSSLCSTSFWPWATGAAGRRRENASAARAMAVSTA